MGDRDGNIFVVEEGDVDLYNDEEMVSNRRQSDEKKSTPDEGREDTRGIRQ